MPKMSEEELMKYIQENHPEVMKATMEKMK